MELKALIQKYAVVVPSGTWPSTEGTSNSRRWISTVCSSSPVAFTTVSSTDVPDSPSSWLFTCERESVLTSSSPTLVM